MNDAPRFVGAVVGRADGRFWPASACIADGGGMVVSVSGLGSSLRSNHFGHMVRGLVAGFAVPVDAGAEVTAPGLTDRAGELAGCAASAPAEYEGRCWVDAGLGVRVVAVAPVGGGVAPGYRAAAGR